MFRFYFSFVLLWVFTHAYAAAPLNPATATNVQIAGYGASEYEKLLEHPYNFPAASLSSTVLPSTYSEVETAAAAASNDMITRYVLSLPPSPAELKKGDKKEIDKGEEKATELVASIPAEDFYSMAQATSEKKVEPNNNNLDFTTLFEPMAYADPGEKSQKKDKNEMTEQEAKNFIYAVMHMGGVQSLVPSLDSESAKKSAYGEQTFKNYLANYRFYTAMQSVAASNLLYLYQERKVVPKLAKKAGLTKKEDKTADMSPLQLQHTIASSRLQEDWYKNMVKASPAAVERERLFIEAEIRYALFQQHLDNERLLATMTALLLQGSSNYRGVVLVTQFVNLGSKMGGGTTSNPSLKSAAGQVDKPLPAGRAGK